MTQKFDSRYISVLARIRGRIAVSRMSIWAEVLTRRFWPLATFLLLAYAFTAFGGFKALPDGWRTPVLIGSGLIALGLAIWGGWRFRSPDMQAALDRLDDSVPNTPLASLRDSSAVGHLDPLTRALWDKHQSRMVDQALATRTAPPDLHLSSRDRYGLRLMALVAAFAAITFAPRDIVNRVTEIFAEPGEAAIATVSYEAWATPPDHTGRPVIYLLDVENGQRLNIPAGTELIFRVYGADVDKVSIAETISGQDIQFAEDAEGAIKALNFDAVQNGSITLLNGGDELAQWDFTIDRDAPPKISVDGEIAGNQAGAMQLPFLAEDDYGVISGTATITLDLPNVDRRYGLIPAPDPLEPIVLDLPMPYTGTTTQVVDRLTEDLSKHIWAHLPVIVTLTVTDAAGQEGTIDVPVDALPGRGFYVPLAAALVEQRRDLLWSRENAPKMVKILKSATYLPDDLMLSSSSYLLLRTIIRRLDLAVQYGVTDQEREELAELLWQVALDIEDGDLANARERLRRAQERLANALEQGADQSEIDRLMDELREATDDYLQALADEAMQDGDTQSAENMPQDGEMLTEDMIQEMLDKIQELSENGQNQEAQELLQQLQELLENLQMAESQGGEGQQDGPMGQQMQDMQDALRDQQELSDDTFRDLQQSQDPNGESNPTQEELAQRQEELREQLEDMQRNNPSGAGEEALEQAERDMEGARDALEQGDSGEALDRQADAIENLREGIRELAEDMQQAQREATGQQGGETETDSVEVDPLGRPLGEDGRSSTTENMLQGPNAMDRARELLDEIRRRSGETDRPQIELDYLKRLLEQF